MIDHTNKQFESLAGMVATDPVVEANRELLLQRSRLGISKYGVTLAGAGLSRKEVLRHALEEALDLANYLQTELMDDRASRQVANKAEVEPVAHLKFWASQSWSGSGNHDIEHGEGLEVCNAGEIGDDGKPAFPVYATPPATTGASTAPRPTDDDLWDATLRDRDAYHEWADKLADAIANHFGVDIGEHSNQNLPWDEALQAIENAEPVGASTILTDTQIIQAWASVDTGGNGPELVAFGRAVERLVVAAQAGQVAVPEAEAIPEWLASYGEESAAYIRELQEARAKPVKLMGCRACYGSGGKRNDPCQVCDGTGKVPK